MEPHAETLRPPVEQRPRRAPSTPPPPQADHGLMLLIIFTASVLLIVALVVLAGAVGHTWILAPIMAVDFAVTAAVLVTVANLLGDADS